MHRKRRTLWFLFGLLSPLSCATLATPAERYALAKTLAARQHWHVKTVPSDTFSLTTYQPQNPRSGPDLRVYIEGDGFAWVNRQQPSNDPTPLNPVGLRLALQDPWSGPIAYVARPCQYQTKATLACKPMYWTHARFAPDVISATHQVLDQLKFNAGAQRLTLVGYSGGAAVAALLAAHRTDVQNLITVAGNLNHATWTQHHRISPLYSSLNPADAIDPLTRVHQWHFVGGQDRIMPAHLIRDFAQRFPASQQPHILEQPDYTHHCCWADNWPQLIRQVPAPQP